MDALVELAGITKRFGDTVALAPTDLQFERGKTTALIGPSGCGKSTLLRLIIGLVEPDAGVVRFSGNDITRQQLQEFRHRVGYVIQDGGLFPHLTARENVLLLPRHLARTHQLDGFKPSSLPTGKRELEVRVRDLCALTRFPSDALDRYPAELSGGQRQRVSLMRALALSPELLLLDEPLGALDPLVRASLQRDLKEVFTRLGQTAILVTHDLAEAAYLAETIVLMNEGRIVQTGTLRELRQNPADNFVTQFVNAQRTLVLT